MKNIRTKLVLSLLIIALLPVLPVYYLVKNLLVRSLEVGYNENVERALEHAAEISRELYAKYKTETLEFAIEAAGSDWAKNLMNHQNRVAAHIAQNANKLGRAKIDFFDLRANLLYTGSSDPQHLFPKLYQNNLAPLLEKNDAQILTISDDPGHIFAFAPIEIQGSRRGFLVVTRAVDETFTRGSAQVVKVHQIFKSLNLFEDDLARGFLLSFFAVYVPLAALSIGVGVYFSRKITNPLLLLVGGTKKIAAGNWDYRVPVTSKDEVGELVTAFNNMIATLKEKQEQVIALEKMAVWREIARILAHEIKNPLTPIQLTVQQMKDKYPGDDLEYRRLLEECTEIVTDEIESLRTLVREFSEFARMPKLNPAPGNLNELVQEVSKLYSNSNLKMELDFSLPEFKFDYEKLRRALINLIDNAIDSMKTRTDPLLQIQTQKQADKAILRVTDNGCGVPVDLQAKIFEPYFSTKKTGMGLGLAIVKRIVDEHGGKIALESKVGEGTTFKITLESLKSLSH